MEEIGLIGDSNKILGLEPGSQQTFSHFKIFKTRTGNSYFVLENLIWKVRINLGHGIPAVVKRSLLLAA